jgi:hypothetical protein
MKESRLPLRNAWGLFTVLLLVFNGCGKPQADVTPTATPPKPKEAASQLQQAFVSANVEVKNTANVVSEALRTADYEKAIDSLQTIKARQNLTFEQGMAVYNSERALEARLIAGVNAGDPNAKRAYELLKQRRRN